MGSIAKTGFSIANLLQTLTSAGSPQLSAALSSPAVQTALQTARPGDLVDLSDQAMQLQEASQLLGTSSTADTATLPAALDPLSSLLASTSSTAPSVHPLHRLLISLVAIRAICSRKRCRRSSGLPQPSSLFDALG